MALSRPATELFLIKRAFPGSFLKIKRAYKHINELEEWIRWFKEARSYDVGTQVNAETGENEIGIIAINDDTLMQAGPIIGDIAHNLRSALDHFARSLVERCGESPIACISLWMTLEKLLKHLVVTETE
jgi:hypothetical protein